MKIIWLFLFQFISFCVLANEYVNLKYLSKENIDYEFKYDINCIKVIKNNKTIKIFPGTDFILTDDTVVKVDCAPFVENGNIFISKFTYDVVNEIFSGKYKITKEIKNQVKTKETEDKSVEWKKEVIIKEPQKIEIKEKLKNNQQKIIVIDPGHGGNDPGAIGRYLRVKEKEVVLKIAKMIKEQLQRKSKNFKVILTRDDDKFISLKERSLMANKLNANLFVSLHCNSSYNKSAKGTRTYIYSRVASSKDAEEAAKFENRNTGIFEFLLNDLKKNAYEYLSVEAAGYIQHSLAKILRFKWHPTERAPFYVLANTNMPSVLVEVAFISNQDEEKKSNSDYFCQQIADGITEGILEYFDKIQ